MERYISKTAVLAEIEKSVKLLFENNDRIYDAYGNYYYKNAENDYRFYHKLDEDNWDEDKLTLTDATESLFHFNTPEVKEVNLEKVLSDLDKDIKEFVTTEEFEKDSTIAGHYWAIAKHAFLLGLKATQKEE